MKVMRGLFAVLCSVLWVASAEASTCMGENATSVGQMRAGAELNFQSESWGVGGGVGKQFDQFYAGGGVLIQGVSGAGSAKGFFGSARVERTLGASKKYFVCPVVRLVKTFGLDVGGGTSLGTFVVSFGGQVGFPAGKAGNTQMVPTVGYTFNVVRDTYSGGGFGGFSDNYSLSTIQGGVGFLLNDTMSVTPMIGFTFGTDWLGDPAFIVMFSKKVGK